MKKLTIDYVQRNMLDAHFEIYDDNGNWFGITPYYSKFKVVRNGEDFYTGKSLEKCVNVINKEL